MAASDLAPDSGFHHRQTMLIVPVQRSVRRHFKLGM
jgi:hypothetical protein